MQLISNTRDIFIIFFPFLSEFLVAFESEVIVTSCLIVKNM